MILITIGKVILGYVIFLIGYEEVLEYFHRRGR